MLKFQRKAVICKRFRIHYTVSTAAYCFGDRPTSYICWQAIELAKHRAQGQVSSGSIYEIIVCRVPQTRLVLMHFHLLIECISSLNFWGIVSFISAVDEACTRLHLKSCSDRCMQSIQKQTELYFWLMYSFASRTPIKNWTCLFRKAEASLEHASLI